jgi:hypothetical protein
MKYTFNEVESIEPLLTAMEEILTFAKNSPKGEQNSETWLREKNSGGESFETFIFKFQL